MSAVSAGAMGALTGNNSNNGNNSINSTIGGLGIGGVASSVLNSPGNIAGNAMTQAQQAVASITGSVSSALGGADANSISATGFNPNTGNTTPTLDPGISGGNARLTDIGETTFTRNRNKFARAQQPGLADTAGVGNVDPQVQAGGFSPNTSIAAEGIFGSEQARGIQPYKKPLINF